MSSDSPTVIEELPTDADQLSKAPDETDNEGDNSVSRREDIAADEQMERNDAEVQNQQSHNSEAPPKAPLTGDTSNTSPCHEYTPLTTTVQDTDMNFMEDLSFTNRGSVLLGGKKPAQLTQKSSRGASQSRLDDAKTNLPATYSNSESMQTLSEEIEKESLKVRSMYDSGMDNDWRNGNPALQHGKSDEQEVPPLPDMFSLTLRQRPHTARETMKRDSILRQEHELAGGIEDWKNVNGGDVDRYGFIIKKREPTSRSTTPEARPPQRVSTVLHMASEAPRRQRGFGRQLSVTKPTKTLQRPPSRKVSARSLYTQASGASQRSPSKKNLRSLANRFPGNHDRRLMEEAGDMLTLPPGLADLDEARNGGQMADVQRKIETRRAEKWRKMAKVVKGGPAGEGMEFEFDTTNSKLIERTWKGIPDRWRAAAWFSFLSTSAKKTRGSPTDAELIASFHTLIDQSSADDVQIDLDVPRTINGHIMFRRRYRGGQRLLFRVLHCLSLYFPDTGYVQGMASLAATLLCYYDEEKTFVMCTRLWNLRGLAKLYAHGFAGLMSALDEFKTDWMLGHDVSQKLDEMGIEPTAYGTRWYLTLFNYSIPFPAQLRVWDVFMLLGDADPSVAETPERPFRQGLDILHAASAALIDGMRDILLDSDFENAMKVLTSWVPIKDEELFMKVAKAEWRRHQKTKRR
jgi:hypothetical protein